MLSDDYVIVRMDGARDVLGGAASVGAGAPVSAETHTLSAGDLVDVSRDPNVLGVAKKMPVALVTPFEADAADEAGAATAGVAWGLEAVGAVGSPRTGAGVTVAILDTGIDAGHEAFRGTTIVQQDFTGEGDGDGNGHGTHCAGTVFGGEVGGLRIGVAPGVERALIGKVLDRDGSGSTEQILDALLWAAREGANVISMSLGLDFPGLVRRLVDSGRSVEEATSIALEAYRQNVRLFDGVATLIRAHSAMFSRTIVVAAAGNESRRPQFEITTAPPAAADGFISVGALGHTTSPTQNLTVASFSNSGPALAAPGVAIASARVGGGLRTLNGTSMATPHVAGVAALWMESILADNPLFHINELEGTLTGRAAKNVFAAGVDPGDRGAGLVQSPQN